MSRDEAAMVEEARTFLDELFGAGVPIQNLLRTGALPQGCTGRYPAFVERVSAHYGEELPHLRQAPPGPLNGTLVAGVRGRVWLLHEGARNPTAASPAGCRPGRYGNPGATTPSE